LSRVGKQRCISTFYLDVQSSQSFQSFSGCVVQVGSTSRVQGASGLLVKEGQTSSSQGKAFDLAPGGEDRDASIGGVRPLPELGRTALRASIKTGFALTRWGRVEQSL